MSVFKKVQFPSEFGNNPRKYVKTTKGLSGDDLVNELEIVFHDGHFHVGHYISENNSYPRVVSPVFLSRVSHDELEKKAGVPPESAVTKIKFEDGSGTNEFRLDVLKYHSVSDYLASRGVIYFYDLSSKSQDKLYFLFKRRFEKQRVLDKEVKRMSQAGFEVANMGGDVKVKGLQAKKEFVDKFEFCIPRKDESLSSTWIEVRLETDVHCVPDVVTGMFPQKSSADAPDYEFHKLKFKTTSGIANNTHKLVFKQIRDVIRNAGFGVKGGEAESLNSENYFENESNTPHAIERRKEKQVA